MTIRATTPKIRRSFTLSPEAVLEAKRQEIDAAYKEYYDTASDEELAEQREWAQGVGPNILIEAPDI
jgi:hypothetical protein